jgi:hypothetical protein
MFEIHARFVVALPRANRFAACCVELR